MVRKTEAAAGIAYPQLSKEQIDLLIDSVLFSIRNRELGKRMDEAEMTAAKLTEFYTRRWGMPPSITERVAYLHPPAAG